MTAARRILVATDGSRTADAAGVWAAALAQQVGAEVVMVHVFDRSRYMSAGPSLASVYLPVDVDEARRNALDDVAAWSRSVVEAGVRCRTVLAEGRPAPAILRTAHAEAVDLIVMGTRGHGSFTEMFLGSVAHEVTRRAEVPVVTVPPGAAAAAASALPARAHLAS